MFRCWVVSILTTPGRPVGTSLYGRTKTQAFVYTAYQVQTCQITLNGRTEKP